MLSYTIVVISVFGILIQFCGVVMKNLSVESIQIIALLRLVFLNIQLSGCMQ